MRALIISAVVISLCACTQDIPRTTVHLKRPVDMSVICVIDGDARPQSDCDDGAGVLLGYVVNSEIGSVARVNLRLGSAGFVDDDPFIPGFSPLPVGVRPVASLSVVDDNGGFVFVANAADGTISRINVEDVSQVVVQALTAAPSAMVMHGSELLVALPDRGLVARIPDPTGAAFGALATLDTIPTPGGSPYDLDVDDQARLWVAHADRAYVSVVDLASGAVVADIPIAAQCADDLDNDGNGVADNADWGCRWGAAEGDPPEGWVAPTIPTLPAVADHPACRDDIDQDMDGNKDFPDDPDCSGPTGSVESVTARKPVLGKVRVAPGGRNLVYALNIRDGVLVPIDTATLTPIDVNAEAAAGQNPLFRRLGRQAITLPGHPETFAFAEHSETGQLKAYVGSTNGKVYVIDVEDDRSQTVVHRMRDADLDQVTADVVRPRLFQGSDEIPLGSRRRTDRPSFGELNANTPVDPEDPEGRTTDYAILMNLDPEAPTDDTAVLPSTPVVGELWNVTHGGAVISRLARLGAFNGLTFETPEPAYCDAGVEPGDVLVLSTMPDPACCSGETCDNLARAKSIGWTITAVTQFTLELEAGSGRIIERLTEEDEEAEGLPIPDPSAECYPDGQSYSVRVPRGMYTVVGSVSGLLHPWFSDADGVCQKTDDEALYHGRLQEWTLKQSPLLECLPNDTAADDWFEGSYFENHAFKIRMLPGCEVSQTTEDGTVEYKLVDTRIDVRWQFIVDSTVAAVAIGGRTESEPVLGLPRALEWASGQGVMYVIDGGIQQIVEILTDEDVTRTRFL